MTLTLREQQSLFATHIAQLILWINSQPDWAVTLADGSVDLTRKYRKLGVTMVGTDAQHMEGSLHYQRLAQDLNLFVEGHLITVGNHSAWKTIGEKWESMHPLARWGGRFNDANHFSFAWGGKA